jgi:hypothetical protein
MLSAILALDIALLKDNAGSPGLELQEPPVVGEVFWVEVGVQDLVDPDVPGDTSTGVVSLPLNLTWDVDVIQFIGVSPDTDHGENPGPVEPVPVPLDNPIVTPRFPRQRFLDDFVQTETDGRFQNLRGGTVPAEDGTTPIGIGEPGWFSHLRFQAVGAASAMPFTMSLAGSMAFSGPDSLTGFIDEEGEIERDLDANPVVFSPAIRVQSLVEGRKFNDVQGDGFTGDGVNDGSNSGLAGWEIRAYADDGDGLLEQDEYDAGEVAVDTTTADGSYGLRLDTGPAEEGTSGSPAHYIIVEVPRDGWEQTFPDNPVLDAGLDTGSETLGEHGYAITVNVGTGNFEDRDFGNWDVTPSTSSLSGFVYADTDNDGQRKVDEYGAPRDGDSEMGLPNVTISLFRDDQLRDQTTTGPGGRYHFEGLEPGTYEIREEQPDCFIDGKDGKDPDTPGIVWTGQEWEPRGEVGDDRFFDIVLGPDEHGVDYNFGELGLKAECINKRMFVASTPSAKEPVAERLGVETETVLGTDGDDEIEFHAERDDDETVMVVTVNGSEKEFLISETRMVLIDARGGEDNMTLTLTEPSTPIEPEEKVYALPGYATLRHETRDGILRDWDYGVEVVNAETIDVDDHAPGDNLAVLRDSPRSDALTAEDDTATLTAEELEGIVRAVALSGVDRVMAISASGGDDTAKITPHDFVLERVGDWRLLPDP